MVAFRGSWSPSLLAFFTALATSFCVAPALTHSNLLEGPVREVSVTLTEGTNMAVAPSPDGETLVLALQGSLWTLPLDAATPRATRITTWDVEATWPTWSPDGSRIAFQRYSDSNYQIWTIAPDGSALTQVTSGGFDHREPAWSPDGRRLAFASDRGENGSYEIWTVEVATGTYEQRTRTPAHEHSPAWSPDGARLLWAEGRNVLAGPGAAGAGGSGAPESLATVPSGAVLAPAWLPDGRGVAYLNERGALVVGGQVVSDGEDVFPFPARWLPDGRYVYTANGKIRARGPAGGGGAAAGGTGAATDIPFSADLALRRPVRRSKDHGLDGSAPRPVHGIQGPALSPDGTRVAFVALNDLWVMTIGQAPVRLTQDSYVDLDPAWSRDGATIFFASDRHGDGSPDIYAAQVATSAVTRVSNIPETDVVTPVPSPDGRSFAYISTDQSLMVYDVASRSSRKLVDQAEGSTVGRPTWSADGRTIALGDLKRLNTRFREGYHYIRTVDVATGAAAFQAPGPAPDQLSDRVEAGPVWSPDGRSLAFVMNATLHVLPVDAKGVPTGPARRLTDHAADMPSWSGDSRTLLYVANGQLRTISADGTGGREVAMGLTWRPEVVQDRRVIHAGALWDGVRPELQRNVDVVLVGNRIEAVRPHGAHGSDPVIDGSQLTLMPGLWDAHIHPRTKDSMGQVMALFLSYGITSVASMGWGPYHSLELEESLEAGTMVGPRLFTSGPQYEGNQVFYSQSRPIKDPSVAALELGKARVLGLDHLKGYVRTPVWLMAEVARTAQEMGVPSATHFLSPGIQTGLTSTTHLSATQRMGYSWSQSRGGRSYQDVVALFTQGDFDLTTTHSGIPLLGDDPAMVEDPRFRLLMPEQYVEDMVTPTRTRPTDAQRAQIARSLETATAIMKGGGLVALGTDTPLAAPAFTLHMALRALPMRMSTHEALQTATVNAARFAGAGAELGTVEAGKVADLILIRGDPLANVANTANVEVVVKNGVARTVEEILRPYASAAAAAGRAP